jgi:hypothetical protein
MRARHILITFFLLAVFVIHMSVNSQESHGERKQYRASDAHFECLGSLAREAGSIRSSVREPDEFENYRGSAGVVVYVNHRLRSHLNILWILWTEQKAYGYTHCRNDFGYTVSGMVSHNGNFQLNIRMAPRNIHSDDGNAAYRSSWNHWSEGGIVLHRSQKYSYSKPINFAMFYQ